MIIGTGSDLVDIRRIDKLLQRFGPRFIARCFTQAEINRADTRAHTGQDIATYAKRFAAKEACAKALGTGIARGVRLKDISVTQDELGRPALVLSGGANSYLERLTPEGKQARLHVSLSDEPPYALAHVIIEAV